MYTSMHTFINELRRETLADWAKERRTEYLKDRITDLIVEAWAAIEAHEDYVNRNRLIEMILTRERFDRILKDILKAQGEIIALRVPGRLGRDQITPEMIEQARAYPFTQLYEFKRNMARCPFHEDRTPSFALMKDNRARCFGACGRSWDTIAFIRDREGLSFPEAVRRLQ